MKLSGYELINLKKIILQQNAVMALRLRKMRSCTKDPKLKKNGPDHVYWQRNQNTKCIMYA